jgi:hypothetical protein
MQPGGAPYIPQQPASQVPVGYVAQQPVVMQPPPGVYAGAVAPPADGQPHVIGYDEFGRPIYAAQTKAVMMRSTVNGVVQRSWVGNLCGCCGYACPVWTTPQGVLSTSSTDRGRASPTVAVTSTLAAGLSGARAASSGAQPRLPAPANEALQGVNQDMLPVP